MMVYGILVELGLCTNEWQVSLCQAIAEKAWVNYHVGMRLMLLCLYTAL